MQAVSAVTNELEPYRAGVELGGRLRALHPEVVLLFTSIHYQGNPALLDGVYDALDNPGVLLIGNTGDGYLEGAHAGEVGAAALGLSSQGQARWGVGWATGVAAAPEEAVARALAALEPQLGAQGPALLVALADFHVDGTRLVRALQRSVRVPVVGGLAGDNHRMERSFVYANRRVLQDGLAILGVGGPVRFDIHVAGNLAPVGQAGTVTRAQGTTLAEIDGIPAVAFIEREAGKAVSQADVGISAFLLSDAGRPELCRLRSVAGFNAQGEVALFGGVQAGAQVQLCYASPELLLQEVRDTGAAVRAQGVKPCAAVVISCAGRKWVLGNRMDLEIRALQEGLGHPVPLVGFPSYGEIGPQRDAAGYTRTLFHNVTHVLLVLGEAP